MTKREKTFDDYCRWPEKYCAHRLNVMLRDGASEDEMIAEATHFNNRRVPRINPQTGKEYHWGEEPKDIQEHVNYMGKLGVDLGFTVVLHRGRYTIVNRRKGGDSK